YFEWQETPNYMGVGQFISLRQAESVLKKELDIFRIETECLTCEYPSQFLFSMDFGSTESLHVHVFEEKLRAHCQCNCPYDLQIRQFHRAFIDHLIEKNRDHFVLHGDLVLPYENWTLKYCEKLEEVACQVLESRGEPMHFVDIADTIRRNNVKYKEMSDNNLHAAIIRYDSIEIVGRGTYGLKSWGLDGYRSVSTAIEALIDEKGLPQRRQDIIQHLSGEFKETNISSALSTETRFKSIGDGFYDRADTWPQRSCEALITLLPESVAEFVRYLVGKRNHSSYKLVMAFIFIRSMDKDGGISLSSLKDMFYNFYLSRHEKGLVVEDENTTMYLIGKMSAEEVKFKTSIEPLKSFKKSDFIFQNRSQLYLDGALVNEFQVSSVRNLVIIVLLKAISDYFKNLEPFTQCTGLHQPDQRVEEDTSIIENEMERVESNFKNTGPTISIKRKKRGKIRI
ncbi:MAG: winged helix-turn-helix domain-containing protein, partial [Desulfamplus sp.]|nr:winged helix-turn-helix domain-containing protein [Desulfamplus sp.]